MKLVLFEAQGTVLTFTRDGITVTKDGVGDWTSSRSTSSAQAYFDQVHVLGNANRDNDAPYISLPGYIGEVIGRFMRDDVVVTGPVIDTIEMGDVANYFTAVLTTQTYDWSGVQVGGVDITTLPANRLALGVDMSDQNYRVELYPGDFRTIAGQRAMFEAAGATVYTGALYDLYILEHTPDAWYASPEGGYARFYVLPESSALSAPYTLTYADFASGGLWNNLGNAWVDFRADIIDLMWDPVGYNGGVAGGAGPAAPASDDGKEVAIAAIAGGLIGYHMGKARS